MSVLSARDLSVIPPGSSEPVLRDLSLELQRGEWLAVTGPNGGGKTSLLLGLAGLWPTRGELHFEGAAFGVPGSPRPHGIAVVLQDPSTQILQPTVREELAFGLRNQGASADQIEEQVRAWSAVLDLDPDRNPAALSAGQQQTVLMAAALASRPRLLLADEPTAHLDARTRSRVLGWVGEQVVAGMAVAWITQLEDEIALAHRRLEVGSPMTRQSSTPTAERSGAERLRIRIEPLAAEPKEGPRVLIETPLELALPCRGVTGIVGPNGVGKSAVLGAVAGYSPIDQVSIAWRDPPDPPPIATLQYPELQIFEEDSTAEVTYAAISRGMARDEALDLATNHLRTLGMAPDSWRQRRTWVLSTGEKRLLEVVGALIAPASLYVLDEPTAGLDPVRKQALGGLVAVRAGTHPVLVASQDTEWLRGIGSEVIELGFRAG